MKKVWISLSSLAAFIPLVANAAFGLNVMIDGKTVIFTDVPQSAWFTASVQTAAEAGIVSGYKDDSGKLTGMFGPSNHITVAEALKIASEGAGYDESLYGSQIASGMDHWSSAYVSVAMSEQFPVITHDVNLDRSATRAEVAAMLSAAFDVNLDVPASNRYSDVEASGKFSSEIEALSQAGVVSGDTDAEGTAVGTFRPWDPINRAEVTKMIVQARAVYGTPGHNHQPMQSSSAAQADLVVRYTDNGFEPEVLRIQKGQAVSFRNETTGKMWVASDPHPTHTTLSAFDALKGYAQGETYVYTFTKAGTFGFHNHLNASHRGSIVVEE